MKEGAGKTNVSGKAGAKNTEGTAKRPTQHYHGGYPLRDGSGTQTSENEKKSQPKTMRYR